MKRRRTRTRIAGSEGTFRRLHLFFQVREKFIELTQHVGMLEGTPHAQFGCTNGNRYTLQVFEKIITVFLFNFLLNNLYTIHIHL